LRDDHETTSSEQGAEVGRVGVQLLDLAPARLVLVELLGFFAGGRNERAFGADLFGGGSLVDLAQDDLGLGDFAVVDELAR